MKRIEYRAHNGYDTRAASDEAVAWTDPGESMTVQSQAEDADINVLMKRYGITGKLPEDPRVPMYGDFTDVMDYRTAVQAIRNAETAFAEYPADVRSRFENNPQLMLEFIENPSNREEARRLGLLKAAEPVPATPPATGVAAPPQEGPKAS